MHTACHVSYTVSYMRVIQNGVCHGCLINDTISMVKYAFNHIVSYLNS